LVGYVCKLHNIVNERLDKPIFDCNKAFDFWGGGCGCGDTPRENDEHPVNSPVTITPVENSPNQVENTQPSENITISSPVESISNIVVPLEKKGKGSDRKVQSEKNENENMTLTPKK
jgi:hypothetical protein